MSDLLDDIRLAIDSFALARARDLLREALKSPTAETYFLAAQVALDEDQKTRFLEQAVALDPFHEKAVAALGQQKIDAPPVRNVSSPAPVPEYVTARAKLEAAAERLKAGEDFAVLAKELSQDPGSADNGGDLGFLLLAEPEKRFIRGHCVISGESASG